MSPPKSARPAAAPTPPAPPAAPRSLALHAKGVYRFHELQGRRIPVLLDVSFEVARGDFVAIMGPSGSGKTTLLQILAGLDLPSAGSVEVLGQPLEGLDERARTLLRRDQIGFVFQFFNLLPTLTVAENVLLPLRIAGRSLRDGQLELVRLLQQFGLSERSSHLPSQLSGGEMQRTSIARALVSGAPVLLCDEPTGNLSTTAGLEVMEALRHCREREKRTILLVTHNARDAAFADRVLVLRDGALVPDAAMEGPNLTAERIHETLARLKI